MSLWGSSAQELSDVTSKTVTRELSSLDLHLIDELQSDGRMPFSEIARLTGVTEKTARRRVSQLLERNIIQISAVTDPSLLGFEAPALVLITTDGTTSNTRVARELATLPEVDYVTVTSGPFALQAEVMCLHARELHETVYHKIQHIPGVRQVEALPFLRLHYQQAAFSFSKERAAASVGVRPRPLNDTDRQIITNLADNGRASFRELAQKLDVSETTVRTRYAKLIESGAVRVMCIVNPLSLGRQGTCWTGLRLGANAKATEVAEALTEVPEVSYVAITAGRFDLLIEIVTANGEELLRVLDEHIRPLPGVRESETWLYADLHYKALRPRVREAWGHESDIQIV